MEILKRCSLKDINRRYNTLKEFTDLYGRKILLQGMERL